MAEVQLRRDPALDALCASAGIDLSPAEIDALVAEIVRLERRRRYDAACRARESRAWQARGRALLRRHRQILTVEHVQVLRWLRALRTGEPA